jgi:membrane complex biogenesis BtpA family protein
VLSEEEHVSTIAPTRPDPLLAIFGQAKPLIGMVHLRPLPGAPRYDGSGMEPILRAAVADAQAWEGAGADGLIVENHGDIPFLKPEEVGPETVAAMTAAAIAVRQAVHLPVGINCLANAALQAIAIATAAGAAFVRVNEWANAYVANEGLIEGPAARVLRYRAALRATTPIFADVHVKHGAHAIVADRSLAELTRDAVFFDADVLIATGQRTGDATPVEEVREMREAAEGRPVLIGSGLTPENAAAMLAVANGAIAGSWAKERGVWWGPVSLERARRLVAAVRRARG